jgi:hypothetical protein
MIIMSSVLHESALSGATKNHSMYSEHVEFSNPGGFEISNHSLILSFSVLY